MIPEWNDQDNIPSQGIFDRCYKCVIGVPHHWCDNGKEHDDEQPS